MLVDFIANKRREYKQRLEEQNWRHYPQYPNGTLITGRLTEAELAAAAQTTSPLSSAAGQAHCGPFIPPEIVREIIRHATDTFPAPFSIHYPIPPISKPLSPPLSPPPRFPYSNYVFKEDRDVDRKLHALSMKIKLSVSRVSRMWRDVAAEFLFNSIRIYHTWQISLLWRAFEGDARRRGEGGSIETAAPPGSAPWWVRELWLDFHQMTFRVQDNPWEFGLADLLRICPNIVVYRGLGQWGQFPFSTPRRHRVAFMQVLGLPGEWGHETDDEAYEMRGSELDVQDTGRRIELRFTFVWEPSFPLVGRWPSPTPRTLSFPCISSMELRSLYLLRSINLHTYNTFQLPNLLHLSLRGQDSITCATGSLILPSLRSVTVYPDITNPTTFEGEPPLAGFLEKHGRGLEELTVLERWYSSSLRRLDQLCPILQTFRSHYSELPTSVISSVRTVGLYGLEYAGKFSESGKSMISSIFNTFPNVTTIQDLSWRSGVFRRRAYTSWMDPEGAKRREFWIEVILAIRTRSQPVQPIGSDEEFTFREVVFLDWRGEPVEPVPREPMKGRCAVLGSDDQLLDALVSGREIRYNDDRTEEVESPIFPT